MTADETVWKPVEGDHADDQSYERAARDPNAVPTDEQRTQEEIDATEAANKEAEKAAKKAEKSK